MSNEHFDKIIDSLAGVGLTVGGMRATLRGALWEAHDMGESNMRAYAELATEALTELLRQVEAFVAENGEADFYTGQAKEVLAKNPFDPLRHETCTKTIERAAAEFCNAYHAEFFSAQAVTEKWPGWVDGYDPGETIDAAFLALRSALNDSRHQSCNNTAALTAAFGLLRRVRDRVDTVQFFEANAVMGLIEEALRDTASTVRSGPMDTTAGTSSPAAAGVAPASLHQVGRESSGADAIAAERVRQMEVEKWNTDHDDDHEDASLTHAALCYARLATFQIEDKPYAPILRAGAPIDWPWTPDSYKPKDARRNLVRAGALIAAEIDRLDRADKSQSVACTKQEDQ